jgi:phosphonate transport system substrate-binding protein
MRRLLALVLLILVAPMAGAAGHAVPALKLGLFPNLTPLTLIAMYQPLRLHLEKVLHRPVELLTAPDFRAFAGRTEDGLYDAILTAPHLARLAELNASFEAVATYDEKLRALLVVASNSPTTRVADLRGGRIAEPEPLAVVAMLGRSMLADAGVDTDEVTWVTTHSHNGAALAALTGRTRAALVGSVPFGQLPEETRHNLRILASSQAIPNQVWLVNKHLPADQRRAFQDALLSFAKTRPGKLFLKSRACGGIRKLQPNELKVMDPFVQEAGRRLGTGK